MKITLYLHREDAFWQASAPANELNGLILYNANISLISAHRNTRMTNANQSFLDNIQFYYSTLYFLTFLIF